MLAGLARTAGGLLSRRAGVVLPLPVAASRPAGGGVIDTSRFPRLEEHELEERFVRGSGPGGQSVNKTANCVSLKHVPTGLVVKCHESRSLESNRRVARQLLAERLDRLLNGQQSVAAQRERSEQRRHQRSQDQRRRRRDRKQQWRQQRDSGTADDLSQSGDAGRARPEPGTGPPIR